MLKHNLPKESSLPPAAKTRRPFASVPWSYVALAIGVAIALYLLAVSNDGTHAWQQKPSAPFNGERAYGYLKQICAIGPRVSGTEGMRRQQVFLKEHFEKLGGQVMLQEFDVRHPQNGQTVRLANLIVEWHPERKER